MPTVTDEVVTYFKADVDNFVAGASKMEKAGGSLITSERKLKKETKGLVEDISRIGDATQLGVSAVNRLSRALKLGLGPALAIGIGTALKSGFEEVAERVRNQLKELSTPLRIPVQLGHPGQIESQITAAKANIESIRDKQEDEKSRPKSLIERGDNFFNGTHKIVKEAGDAAAEAERLKINLLVKESIKLREQDVRVSALQLAGETDAAAIERQRLDGIRTLKAARFEERQSVAAIVDLQEKLLKQQLALTKGETTRAAQLKLAQAETPVGDRQGIERLQLRRKQLLGDLYARQGVTLRAESGQPYQINAGEHKKLTAAEVTEKRAELRAIDEQIKAEERATGAKQRGLELERARLRIGEETAAQREKIFALELSTANAEIGFAQAGQQRYEAETKLLEVVRRRIDAKEQEIAQEEHLREAFEERALSENRTLFAARAQTLIHGQANAGNKQTAELLQIRIGAQEKISEAEERAKKLDKEGNKAGARLARAQGAEARTQESQDLEAYGLEHDPRRRGELRRRLLREKRDPRAFAQNAQRAERLAGGFARDYAVSRDSIHASGAAGVAADAQRKIVVHTEATAKATAEAAAYLKQLAGRPPLL